MLKKNAVILLLATGFAAYGQSIAPEDSEETLRRFLIHYFESEGVPVEGTRYADAFVDLNGDGTKEVVVYLASRGWCGTGGCITLVLKPKGSSYQIVGKIAATRAPIRVLKQTTHGWRVLTVWKSGGGVPEGYQAKVPFDGLNYPTGTGQRIEETQGDVLIPESADDVRNDKLLIPDQR